MILFRIVMVNGSNFLFFFAKIFSLAAIDFFSGCSFPHHADINKYMKDYKKERRAKLQDNCGYEVYGLDEITKAYESLGIPKFPVPRISRCAIDCNVTFI